MEKTETDESNANADHQLIILSMGETYSKASLQSIVILSLSLSKRIHISINNQLKLSGGCSGQHIVKKDLALNRQSEQIHSICQSERRGLVSLQIL